MERLADQIIELIGRAEDRYRPEQVVAVLSIYQSREVTPTAVTRRLASLRRWGLIECDELGYLALSARGQNRFKRFRTSHLTAMRRIPLCSERRRASHT